MQTEGKTWIKGLALFLVLVLIISSVPSQVYAITGEALRAMSATGLESDAHTVYTLDRGVYEVTELREENVKHFALADGTYTAAVYGVPVHTQDANGNWQDIDNRLSESGSEFTTSNARIKFAKKITGNEVLFTLHDGNRKITMSLDNAIKKTSGAVTNNSTEFDSDATELQKQMTLDNLSSTIMYADILNGVDLEYVVESLNVKENIIVKEAKDSYQYTFTIALNNLEAVLCEDGAVQIYDPETLETVYNIPAGFMYDADGAYSTAVIYTLTDNGNGKYSMTVTANAEWINAEERVFPVVIDPTIETADSTYFEETFIHSGSPNDPLSEYDFLCAGRDSVAYWKLTTLPSLPVGAYITEAHYSVSQSTLLGWWAITLGVFPVESDWDADTFCYSQYESGEAGRFATSGRANSALIGAVDASLITYNTLTEEWDITNCVREWYAEPETNYGIAITSLYELDASGLERQFRFYSGANGAVLTVDYAVMGTMKDYWSYSTQSVGTAGTGYVNNANGTLSFSIGALATTDSLFNYPVTLTYNQVHAGQYVYNSSNNLPNISPTAGYGFSLNVNQYLVTYEVNGQPGYLWTDGNGAEYIFVHDGDGIYRDREGMQLVLQTDGNTFTITGLNHVIYVFERTSSDRSVIKDGALLSQIIDASGNKLEFAYTDYGRVVGVYVTPAGGTSIYMLRIMYNAYGQVEKIINQKTGQYARFYYSASYADSASISTSNYGYLKKIEWITNNEVVAQASYSYDSSGKLISARDLTSNYCVEYTYEDGQVMLVKEFAGASQTEGQTIGFNYRVNYTEIQTSGTDDEYGTDDDILTTYTFDEFGRVVSVYSTDIGKTVIYGATSAVYEDQQYAENNIKTTTTLGGTTSNYLVNGGFEQANIESQSAIGWNYSGSVSYVGAAAAIHDFYQAKFSFTDTTQSELYQYVCLPEGTYTLSVDVSSFASQYVSAALVVESLTNGTIERQTIPVDQYDASGYVIASMTFDATKGEQFKISIQAECSEASAEAYLYVDNVMLERGIGHSGYSMVEFGNFENFSIDQTGSALLGYNDYWHFESDEWENTAEVVYHNPLFGNVLRVTAPAWMEINNTHENENEDSRYIDVYQVIYSSDGRTPITGAKSFVFSAMACGTNQVESGKFGIRIVIKYANEVEDDEENNPKEFSFEPNCTGWQFISGSFKTADDGIIESIELHLVYEDNPGVAYFDNIYVSQIIDESTVSTEYNEDGLPTVRRNGYFEEVYEYDDNKNVTRVANNQGELYDYTYTSDHQVATASYYTYTVTETGALSYPYATEDPNSAITKTLKTRTEYSYNSYGMLLSTLTYNGESVDVATQKITASYTYDTTAGSATFGALLSATDNLGIVTKYFYDSTYGRLLAVINANTGTGTCYTYDSVGNIASVLPATWTETDGYATVTDGACVEYSYDSAYRLQSITTGSTTYSFDYDVFGNSDSIRVGGNEIVSYDYNSCNGKLKKITYANGYTLKYVYNELESISEIWYSYNDTSELLYTYTYDAFGQLYKFTDEVSGTSIVYQYDSNRRLIGYVEIDDTENVNVFSSTILYDDKSRVGRLSYTFDYAYGSNYSDYNIVYHAVYDTDGSLQRFGVSTNWLSGEVVYTYDDFKRLSTKTYSFGGYVNEIRYTFTTTDGNTSAQINSFRSTINGSTTLLYNYTYDDNGNITKVQLSSGKECRYYYDDLGQLLREDNTALNATYVYTYDHAGNILTKSTYALTAEGVTPTNPVSTNVYSYTDENWGDLLTAYKGQTITYDANGNPLSYYNGTSWSFSWLGRQLMRAAKNGATVTYSYNADGIRTQKTVNGVLHTYQLNGSQIVTESWGNHLLIYLYDAEGSPIGMQYRNTSYGRSTFQTFWFEKNLQGDIVAVYNAAGTKLISYTYDAWGKFSIAYHNGCTPTSVASYNPFRYRGYYYDTDTGLYYLQSRYYDPVTCRFLNADVYVSTGQGLLGYNMFAYCNNSPVGAVDFDGERSQCAVTLRDYYIIHKLVQMNIALTYGYAMEVYVNGPFGKKGFLDLYDGVSNQYYEVKHAEYSLAATRIQMSMYEKSTIKSWMFKDYSIDGSPTPGTNVTICGSFTYKDYIIEYFFVAPGLIHYTISSAPAQQLSTVPALVPLKDEKPALALSCCLLVCGGGAPMYGGIRIDISYELAYAY